MRKSKNTGHWSIYWTTILRQCLWTTAGWSPSTVKCWQCLYWMQLGKTPSQRSTMKTTSSFDVQSQLSKRRLSKRKLLKEPKWAKTPWTTLKIQGWLIMILKGNLRQRNAARESLRSWSILRRQDCWKYLGTKQLKMTQRDLIMRLPSSATAIWKSPMATSIRWSKTFSIQSFQIALKANLRVKSKN